MPFFIFVSAHSDSAAKFDRVTEYNSVVEFNSAKIAKFECAATLYNLTNWYEMNHLYRK